MIAEELTKDDEISEEEILEIDEMIKEDVWKDLKRRPKRTFFVNIFLINEFIHIHFVSFQFLQEFVDLLHEIHQDSWNDIRDRIF